jgi:hypothetical protein
MDLQNPALDVCDGCSAGNNIPNSYNRNANRAAGDNHAPLRFVFSGIWDLPFGTGRRYLSRGWQGALAGPWMLTVIYQAQSGLPYTVTLPFDNANAGTTSRPDRLCGGGLDNKTLNHYFDTSCFVAPPQYTFGNSGRNILSGPGENNIDFAVHRVFPIRKESMRLEFRAEAFNLFNHPQFLNPGSTVGTPAYAVISSTAVPNRQLQFALRFSF